MDPPKNAEPESNSNNNNNINNNKKKNEGGYGVSDGGCWAMNVVSSVGLIMVNKQVMSPAGYDFRFATTLTGFHFIVTGMAGYIWTLLGFLPASKPVVPLWDLIWFSLVANASIVGMNLSLMLNSVGFYQISKLSIIPAVCILEWFLHSKTYTREVKASVVVVVLGVGVCTITDVGVNFKGFLCAVVAVLCTSLQQIYIGSFQKKYSIGSFELLSKTAPIQAVSLLIFGPYADYILNGQNVLQYNFSSGCIFFIAISCTMAVFCNLSQYLCIGRFSAVSFQVLGHMKTVCVLVLGWLLFDSVITLKNIFGMFMAVLGMVLYSWAMEAAKSTTQSFPIVLAKQDTFTDEDAVSLLTKQDTFTDEDVSLLNSGLNLRSIKDLELGKKTLE